MSRKYSPSNRAEAKSPLSAYTDNDSDLDDAFASKRSRSSKIRITKSPGTKSVTPTSGSRPFTSGRYTPKSKQMLLIREPNDAFVAKVRPQVLSLDKERLYEEVLALKQTVNKLKHENTRLKTKTAQLERELSRKDTFLNELKSSNGFPVGMGQINVISNLKSTVRDLQEELKQKDAEASLIRRRMHATRIEEMETELQVYADECTRLRHRLTELMHGYRTNESDESSAVMLNMKADRQELEAALADALSESSKWRERVMELEQAKRKHKTSEALKLEVRKLKLSLETMRKAKDEAEFIAADTQSSLERKLRGKVAEADKLIRELESFRRQNDELLIKLAAANQTASEGGDKFKELTRKFEAFKEKTAFSQPEARQLALVIHRKLEETKEPIEKFVAETARTQTLQGFIKAIEKKSIGFVDLRTAVTKVFEDLEVTPDLILRWLNQFPPISVTPKPSPAAQPSPVRSPPVQPNLSLDLSAIKRKQTNELLKHISLRMQLHRVPKRKLMNVMFGDNPDKHTEVTNAELVAIFSSSPFSMTPAESDQIADFLLSKHKTTVSIIGCLFFEIEDWQVFKPEDEEVLDEQLADLLRPIAIDFGEACESVDSDKVGVIHIDDFYQIVDDMQLEISDKQMQYLRLLFYSHKFDFESVPYKQLLNAYTANASASIDSDSSSSELVNSCLAFVAKALYSQNKAANRVFKPDDRGQVNPAEFYSGLQALGYPELERKDFLTIMEALSSEEDEELCIRIEYLEEILSHYPRSMASSADRERYISVLNSAADLSLKSLHKSSGLLQTVTSQQEGTPSSYNFSTKMLELSGSQDFSPTMSNLKVVELSEADSNREVE